LQIRASETEEGNPEKAQSRTEKGVILETPG